MSKLQKDWGVRATIAMVILVPAMGALAYLASTGSGEALTGLVAMASAVSAYYFGQRGQQPPGMQQ